MQCITKLFSWLLTVPLLSSELVYGEFQDMGKVKSRLKLVYQTFVDGSDIAILACFATPAEEKPPSKSMER